MDCRTSQPLTPKTVAHRSDLRNGRSGQPLRFLAAASILLTIACASTLTAHSHFLPDPLTRSAVCVLRFLSLFSSPARLFLALISTQHATACDSSRAAPPPSIPLQTAAWAGLGLAGESFSSLASLFLALISTRQPTACDSMRQQPSGTPPPIPLQTAAKALSVLPGPARRQPERYQCS
jgi:hypothetical protein